MDRLAPIGLVLRAKVILGELSDVIAFGAEVVVNHVENDAQAGGVSLIDEAAEVVGPAVKPGRREQVDAVVTPAETAGEVGHRHHFQHRHAEVGQFLQFTGGRFVSPLLRERADVHLIDHLTLQAGAAPVLVGPGERRRIDDLRRAVRPLRLEARRGIRIGRGVVVQAEAVEAPRARRRRFHRRNSRCLPPPTRLRQAPLSNTTSTRCRRGAQTRKWTPPVAVASAPTGNLRGVLAFSIPCPLNETCRSSRSVSAGRAALHSDESIGTTTQV